jgi:glycosyltransferase involved in cell wall biosynthesis
MSAKVSVVIPVFNAGKYLQETINSLLAQTYPNIEIIIVNNCSTEDVTIQLLNQLGVKYKVIESTIQGLAQARNDGIKEATGEFILPLDADDIIKPTFIESCLDLFRQKPVLALVRTNIELFGAKKGTIIFDEYSYSTLLARNLMVATSMFKKKDWEKVGGYDNSFNTCFEDWEFWIRLLKNEGKVGTIDETLFNYRIQKGSMMHSLKMNNLKEARKRIWEKHREEYGKYFVDPTESFEYKFMEESTANKLGNILTKPFLRFKLMK